MDPLAPVHHLPAPCDHRMHHGINAPGCLLFLFTVSIWIYPTLTTPGCCIHAFEDFTCLLGHSVWSIKCTDFIMGCASLFLFFKLSKFNSNLVVGKSVILFASTLMLTVLMINTTPDVPLIFLDTYNLFFYHAIFEDKTIYWLLGGMAMGLAFDSKYTALMLPAGLILFLLLSQKYRPYLISYKVILRFSSLDNFHCSGHYLECTTRLDVLPVFNPMTVLCNHEHTTKMELFFGSLATQAALLLPILFALIWWLIYRLTKRLS
ncbi:MAG: glycosyltransferase family 39 protein [Saprospiraceae bacterium]|nr:glycosyltransferase family 39 protein [Candidatus Vicinibacter affinis]